jgi:hypothetical protein
MLRALLPQEWKNTIRERRKPLPPSPQRRGSPGGSDTAILTADTSIAVRLLQIHPLRTDEGIEIRPATMGAPGTIAS